MEKIIQDRGHTLKKNQSTSTKWPILTEKFNLHIYTEDTISFRTNFLFVMEHKEKHLYAIIFTLSNLCVFVHFPQMHTCNQNYLKLKESARVYSSYHFA